MARILLQNSNPPSLVALALEHGAVSASDFWQHADLLPIWIQGQLGHWLHERAHPATTSDRAHEAAMEGMDNMEQAAGKAQALLHLTFFLGLLRGVDSEAFAQETRTLARAVRASRPDAEAWKPVFLERLLQLDEHTQLQQHLPVAPVSGRGPRL